MRRKLLSTTVAVLAAVAGSFAIASPASAATAMVWTGGSTNPAGQAIFRGGSPDTLEVCDTKGDGRGVKGVVYVWVASGGFWTPKLTVTDSNSSDGCKTGSLNIASGTKVEILVYQYWGSNTAGGNTIDTTA